MLVAVAAALLGGIVALFTLSLLAVAGESDEYAQRLQRAYERDLELEAANLYLASQLGREPTSRELWDHVGAPAHWTDQ